MSQNYSLFSYKKGSSFLHKMPAWSKLLIIPFVNILFLCLPPEFAAVLILIQLILASCLHFTFKEQITDLKPVIYYAVLLFFFRLISLFISDFSSIISLDKEFIKNQLYGEKETFLLLLKLFCVMQSASLVFKTSTSLELREGIEEIELFIRRIFHRKQSAVLTDAISLFLNFIPMVSKIWNQSKKAWFARGGKHNIRMYLTLLPVLFSVGMKKAWNTSRALTIRKIT